MNDFEKLRKKAKILKRRYPAGTEVLLEHMEGEAGMPAGLRGRITAVDDIGQIHVAWENGRSLALNAELDSFQICESRTLPPKKKSRGGEAR